MKAALPIGSLLAALALALAAPVGVAAQSAPSAQGGGAVVRPSATLGPPAQVPAKGGAPGTAAPRGTSGPGGQAGLGGTLAPGAAESGPPVFSPRGLPNRFRSIAKAETVLFDAPSDKAKMVFVAPAGMPVEVISVLRDWIKFRDIDGDLAWVHRDALADRRTVIVSTPTTLRVEPRAEAEPILDVDRGVLFDLVDDKPTGNFARVRYATGETGYAPVASLWGVR